jgi:hypothetical protein
MVFRYKWFFRNIGTSGTAVHQVLTEQVVLQVQRFIRYDGTVVLQVRWHRSVVLQVQAVLQELQVHQVLMEQVVHTRNIRNYQVQVVRWSQEHQVLQEQMVHQELAERGSSGTWFFRNIRFIGIDGTSGSSGNIR